MGEGGPRLGMEVKSVPARVPSEICGQSLVKMMAVEGGPLGTVLKFCGGAESVLFSWSELWDAFGTIGEDPGGE